ncbi:hypothetical protein AFL01nite_02700 [Aeromicrobium flavum]|uniref:ParB-like N-terminal domain-containing protein n=1 Tax=Aeromicrobium flavum TaxID=416568 RepID=A0A512HR61_9ACTN|nr:ParB N-terminal domain-containing protein [Aeromicrobium flavum]GEO87943.1 hypothetical protein AFL01nite_02700 [Aeromicrobium flavum]
MSEVAGHLEAERRVDAIEVGIRHRRDPGDLGPLIASIERVGLLQPITITPEGVLICGYRRLEAVKRLGWRAVRVWVRPGLSSGLTRLLAERDENVLHKPLTALEAARLYDEVKKVMQEDADRRRRASQFATASGVCAGQPGAGESPAPQRGHGDVRHQAAEFVTHRASYSQLEHILRMERIAADRDQPQDVRRVAEDELERIRNGAPVDPGYQRVRAVAEAAANRPDPDADFDHAAAEALEIAKAERRERMRRNREKRAAAAAVRKRTPRSFVLLWAEMLGWTDHYDAEQIAREVRDDDWQLFEKVLQEMDAFAREVRSLRTAVST